MAKVKQWRAGDRKRPSTTLPAVSSDLYGDRRKSSIGRFSQSVNDVPSEVATAKFHGLGGRSEFFYYYQVGGVGGKSKQ